VMRGQRDQRGGRASGQRSVGPGQHDAFELFTAGRGEDVGGCTLQSAIFHRVAGGGAPALDPVAAEAAVAVPVEDRRAALVVVLHGGIEPAMV
ncbi:MAG: hypothetical protein ACK56I_23775, partial [bacterium]